MFRTRLSTRSKPWWARHTKRARRAVCRRPATRRACAGQSFIGTRREPCNSRVRKSSIRCLQEEGVEYVFGYPGGAVLNIYDELFKQDKVKHVLVRHEQGAVHAADGYSRSSHKIGVALVTSGPGRHQRGDRHRDRVHGFDPDGGHHRPGADARDRPGRVPGMRHRRHHAAVRQAQLPRQGRQGPRARRSRRRSTSPRPAGPGPVLVDIPKDVTQASTEFTYPKTVVAALVQPGDQGPRRADQEGGAAAARGEAADGLHRRRRDPRTTPRRSSRASCACSAFRAPTR